MTLTPKDIGILVDHSVWKRGKVIEVVPPYAIIHFSSLVGTPQGPERKLRDNAEQLFKSTVKSDPDLDGVGVGPERVKKTKTVKKAKAKKPAD
jgi:hypothetical protein